MTVKGKPTQTQRTVLRELIARESPYPLDINLADRFIDMGTIIRLRTGDILTKAGDVDPDFYILIEGIMRCWHLEGDGLMERTSYFGLPGTVSISYHSYLLGLPSPNSYETCCPSTVMRVRKADYSRLIDESPEFARWCLGNVQFQLYFFEKKGRIIQGSARERYESIVRNRPEIVRRVPLKIIASYLGITPQYLSKLRRTVCLS